MIIAKGRERLDQKVSGKRLEVSKKNKKRVGVLSDTYSPTPYTPTAQKS
nr:MAG TPA: hypothetical protein [Caudoviricetes sp.]